MGAEPAARPALSARPRSARPHVRARHRLPLHRRASHRQGAPDPPQRTDRRSHFHPALQQTWISTSTFTCCFSMGCTEAGIPSASSLSPRQAPGSCRPWLSGSPSRSAGRSKRRGVLVREGEEAYLALESDENVAELIERRDREAAAFPEAVDADARTTQGAVCLVSIPSARSWLRTSTPRFICACYWPICSRSIRC